MTETPKIQLDRVYAHPPAAIWRALTTPELHAKWWAPGDVRAELGHRFELDMGAWGKQRCEVTAVEPERLFQYKYAIGVLDTLISWKLSPEGKGTRLTLIHEGFNLDTPMGKKAFEGMRPGWPGVMGAIERVLNG